MPSPAVASMSRSLAPSPTPTRRPRGTPPPAARRPRRGGETLRRGGLARPVHDRADQPPGEPAVGDLQDVRGRVVDAEVGGERVGDLGEAAADDRELEVEPLERADQRAYAR